MTRRVKIAVSLAPEVLGLLDRHAEGRSRSRCVEEELLRALRAREWERLAAQSSPEDAADELEAAESSFAYVDELLARDEGATGPSVRAVAPRRGRRKRR